MEFRKFGVSSPPQIPTGATASSGSGPPPHYGGFRITPIDTSHSVGFLCARDRPVAGTSTWQHTTLTIYRHQCPGRYSNPQSQQTSGCRPTP